MSSRTKTVKVVEPRVPAKATSAQKPTQMNHWVFDFFLLSLVAIWSAYYNGIWDCDESMNYFEPLHHLLFGYGLQTWEYRYAATFSSCFTGLHHAESHSFISPKTDIVVFKPALCSEILLLSLHPHNRHINTLADGFPADGPNDQNLSIL